MKKTLLFVFSLAVLVGFAITQNIANAQATKDKWCVWYRTAAPSHANIQMLPAKYPTCGGSVQNVPNGYKLWVWCRQAGCASAKQALSNHYHQTKAIPDWRGQVR